jgi:adenosylcobinamide-phosphate synthase
MWIELIFTTPNYILISASILIVSLCVDRLLGEPVRFHPLVGFGHWANFIEKLCRLVSILSPRQQGICAWCLSVLPFVFICYLLLNQLLDISLWLWLIFNIVIVYLTLGGKSLVLHADNIYKPLQQGDIEQARYHVSRIVSRNTEKMTEDEIVSSTIESVLENGNDAVFAPMIWFLLLGAPGALLFRLANTLDAMWGYKTEKYMLFGWCSAKIDDLLGWLPARITAFFYAIQGNFCQAFDCWQHQAKLCQSPNGGVVMTTGAGALGIIIGGPTYYHGVLHNKKPMGIGKRATSEAIYRANRLVIRGSFVFSYLWLCLVLVSFYL